MTEERAVLAGGCFWGMQDLIRRYDGVISTRVGYTGGNVPNATYRNHGTHAEAIEIIFDPSVISYRTLLEFFFQIHDPTTLNRQGGDVGATRRIYLSLRPAGLEAPGPGGGEKGELIYSRNCGRHLPRRRCGSGALAWIGIEALERSGTRRGRHAMALPLAPAPV